VSEKLLSEIMSDSNHAIEEAQEALENAILEGIGTHFDAGVQIERERIMNLVLEWQEQMKTQNDYTADELIEHRDSGFTPGFNYLIQLIKGEQK
jgi:hypothetical protein